MGYRMRLRKCALGNNILLMNGIRTDGFMVIFQRCQYRGMKTSKAVDIL